MQVTATFSRLLTCTAILMIRIKRLKWTISQAASRTCLAAAMKNKRRAGVPILGAPASSNSNLLTFAFVGDTTALKTQMVYVFAFCVLLSVTSLSHRNEYTYLSLHNNLEETDKFPKLRSIIYRKGLISQSFFFISTYLKSNLQKNQKNYL